MARGHNSAASQDQTDELYSTRVARAHQRLVALVLRKYVKFLQQVGMLRVSRHSHGILTARLCMSECMVSIYLLPNKHNLYSRSQSQGGTSKHKEGKRKDRERCAQFDTCEEQASGAFHFFHL